MNKKTSHAIFICIAFSLLLIPILYIVYRNDNVFQFYKVILGTVGVSCLILATYLLINAIHSTFAKIVAISSLMFFFFIRLVLSFVYDFSGRGFTSEFFAHFGWKSFVVGLDEYGYVLFLVLIIWVVLIIMLYKILNRQKQYNNRLNLLLLFVSVVLIITNVNAIPELKLLTAYNLYNSPVIETADKLTARIEANNILKPLRIAEKLPVEKNEIIAVAPIKPKNVIIIYLESFSEILTENKKYPGLTPNLDKLKKENISFKNNFSSAYVTIEGIANSQCGTLMNMDNGNNSLTSASGRLPNLPCLGDILHVAGYKQVFYGGADLAFAGKGAFFSEHGYDEVWGKKDWKKQAIKSHNTWGLTDDELFNQALNRVMVLSKEKQPFNLSLLTLGTHIPGFLYKGCEKYKGIEASNSFLDAIHCTDFLIEQFIQNLKNNGILEDTVVYIQGDHGIFPAHSMKQLFAQEVKDRRIFTVILGSEISSREIDLEKPTSTFNLAANILDLLGIQHNIDFIFGYSDFINPPIKPYLITRYIDYFGLEKIGNIRKTPSCNQDSELVLPLDFCEKKRALTAAYRLGASYSLQNKNQEVCELGIDVLPTANNGKISVRWGNENLSDKFYSQGRAFKKLKSGFYMLFLDNKDQVIKQLFYNPKDQKELRILNKELVKKDSRYFLFSNLASHQLLNLQLKNLPKPFIQNKVLYSQNIDGKIISLLKRDYPLGQLNFIPDTCKGGLKVLDYIKPHKIEGSKFCEIINWGPKKITFNEKFHEQTSGNSAFWLKTDCAPEEATIRFNGNILKTRQNLPTITANLDTENLIPQPGLYTLDLYDEKTNTSKEIGIFNVFSNKMSSLVLPINKHISKQIIPPPVLLAHAGGGIKNHRYVNSIEALDFNYQLGHRVFEIDFNWTKDKQLVAIHDWKDTYKWLFNQKKGNQPSLKKFMSLKMNFNQSQLDLNTLNDWLIGHPDAFIVTDVRGRNVKALKIMANQMPTALQQIIPQMYHPKNYNDIKSIGYKNIIFTLYATKLATQDIIKFVEDNDLFAITVHPEKPGFKEIIDELGQSELFIYVHTLNTIAELQYYLSLGVDGLYTDFLYLNKKNEIAKQNIN